jgi:hypothetical protein
MAHARLRSCPRLVLLGILLPLASCGERAADTSSLGSLPASEWQTVFRYALAAPAEEAPPTDKAKWEAWAETLHVLAQRLDLAGHSPFGMTSSVPDAFQVGFQTLSASAREDVQRLLAREGTLEFVIEVLPDEGYEHLRGGRGPEPKRRRIWSGSSETFDTYKEKEIAAWREALAAGVPYEPSRAGYRIVKSSRHDGSHEAHFHVVEDRPPGERLGASVLTDPVVIHDARRRPVVVFEIAPAYQDRFETYTTENVGLPIAILVDGEHHSSPVLQAPLRTNVQIDMGSLPAAEAERKAKELVTILRAGVLPLRPRLLRVEERQGQR